MKRRLTAIAVCLAGCSTTATPEDTEIASAGLMHGIEACHRSVFDDVPLEQAVSEAARGRPFARYAAGIPGSGIVPPSWKLGGQVWVGANDRGGCDIYAASGSGPELRKLAVSTHLGMSSRRWSRMQIVAAPQGQVRDGVCTVDRTPAGKSVGVVMTSRTDDNANGDRTFVATVMQADAASCTSRQIP